MLNNERAFSVEYDARIVDLPATGQADYSFTDGRAAARATTVLVEPWAGRCWIGSFAVGDPKPGGVISDISGTPSPVRACIVERGTAFLVDVLRPDDYAVVSLEGPVVGVLQLVEEEVLLLTTPWSVAAVGAQGVAWLSPRVAIDAMRIDEAEAGWLRGVADPDEEEPRNFAIDLETGSAVGGADIF